MVLVWRTKCRIDGIKQNEDPLRLDDLAPTVADPFTLSRNKNCDIGLPVFASLASVDRVSSMETHNVPDMNSPRRRWHSKGGSPESYCRTRRSNSTSSANFSGGNRAATVCGSAQDKCMTEHRDVSSAPAERSTSRAGC